MREAAINHEPQAQRSRRAIAQKRTLVMSLAAGLGAAVRNHPGRCAAVLSFLVMGGGIVGNAVWFQTGRHPAPLFGNPGHPRGAGAAARTAPVPQPRLETSGLERQSLMPTAETGSLPAGGMENPKPPGPGSLNRPATAKLTSGRRKDDAIGRFLTGARETKAPGVGQADPEAETRVLAAQRALQKLGYAVRPDGHLGTSTRQALEKFRRDRHLVTGDDLSPKLLRELATAAEHPPG